MDFSRIISKVRQSGTLLASEKNSARITLCTTASEGTEEEYVRSQPWYVGIALSQTEDASFSHYVLLWDHGASTVDKESQVAINSPGTRLALDYMKGLYESCMTNEVLSWDDSSNNQAFLGGQYSWVHNAVSIYFVAKNKVPDIAKVTNHALTPSGPGGQHSGAASINYGIWKFAEQKELAKEFLQYLMDPVRLEEMFHATLTYNSPTFKNGENFDWGKDPKTA